MTDGLSNAACVDDSLIAYSQPAVYCRPAKYQTYFVAVNIESTKAILLERKMLFISMQYNLHVYCNIKYACDNKEINTLNLMTSLFLFPFNNYISVWLLGEVSELYMVKQFLNLFT